MLFAGTAVPRWKTNFFSFPLSFGLKQPPGLIEGFGASQALIIGNGMWLNYSRMETKERGLLTAKHSPWGIFLNQIKRRC